MLDESPEPTPLDQIDEITPDEGCKARRLEKAGLIAPILRQKAEYLRTRPIHLFNQQTGEVTRIADAATVQQGILATAGVEFAVTDGKRPQKVFCEACGKQIRVSNKGSIPTHCTSCKNGKCQVCNKELTNADRGKKASTHCRECWRKSHKVIRAKCVECNKEVGVSTTTRKRARPSAPIRCRECWNEPHRPNCHDCGIQLGHRSPSRRHGIYLCRKCTAGRRQIFSDSVRQKILDMYATGVSQRCLAREFGTSQRTIDKIVTEASMKRKPTIISHETHCNVYNVQTPHDERGRCRICLRKATAKWRASKK